MHLSSWLRHACYTACLLALTSNGPAWSQDAIPPEGGAATKDLDQRLHDALKAILNRGADLYNSGDRNGCYHLFQGALLAAKPQLANRPDVQQIITEGLSKADQDPQIGWRAFALRDTIQSVRSKLKNGANDAAKKPDGDMPPDAAPEPKVEPKPEPKPDPKPEPSARKESLWDRLGGEKGVAKIVDDFVEEALQDKSVNMSRDGKFKVEDPKILNPFKKHLIAYLSKACGGPIAYAGKSMKDVHKGMGISGEEFAAAATILKGALEKNNVKPEDVEAVLGAVESTRKDIVEERKPEPEPKVEVPPMPKPEPKVEVPPTPKTEPKVEPKVEVPPTPKPEPKEEMVRVSGALTLNGKPLPGATITYIPMGNRKDKGQSELSDVDGTYLMPEVKPGEYVVIVVPEDKKKNLPSKYSDPEKTELKAKIDKNSNQQNFELMIEDDKDQ